MYNEFWLWDYQIRTKVSPPLYKSLVDIDLEDMTVENTLGHVSDKIQAFDLVVAAADVLVYFGSLDNVLQSFANVSVEGANLIFLFEYLIHFCANVDWEVNCFFVNRCKLYFCR